MGKVVLLWILLQREDILSVESKREHIGSGRRNRLGRWIELWRLATYKEGSEAVCVVLDSEGEARINLLHCINAGQPLAMEL